ncbi:ribosome biogenesis factor YjgA [Teredinibacter turnerae]|uniref:ribosome biogenesis factor YjgA n=1 Tax=Teredinibacter turnerae TaxID=2426 RepID=UPI000360CB7B|nr:ribosome biogenesis factor YjgA [Teredinibacter turnerae]
MHDYSDEDWEDDDLPKSKTQVKKEMTALQDLGVQLIELSPTQLDKLPLSDKLRSAIDDAPKITQRSARKRHFQYIGKLMRDADGEAIEEAFARMQEKQHLAARQHHQIENWRDQLLSGDQQALQAFIDQFPGCQVQQLRNLLRTAEKEKMDNKPPAAARKIFKFVRDCFEAAADDGTV